MAITYTGTGGLFTRVGRVGGAVNNVLGFIGNSAPDVTALWGSSGPSIKCLKDNADNIEAQFASTNQQLIDGLYAARDSYRSAHSGYLSYLSTLASAIVRRQVGDQTTLSSDTIAVAIADLITQMKADAYYVALPTVSVAVTAGSANNGDGVVRASVVNPYGVNLPTVFAETIDVTCTYDSQQSIGVLYRETFGYTGDGAVSDRMAYNWPAGSGVSGTLTALDANSSSSNLLTNGDFESFTGNTPDSWTVSAGTPGTHIFAEGTTIFGNAKSLKYYTNTADPIIYQALTTLMPNTVYCLNVWIQKTAGLVAGVLSFDLHNGTSVIADDASTNNVLTVAYNASGMSSSAFTAYSAFFRTPKVMPATVRFRCWVSTTLTASEGFFIDRMCLSPATQAYAGGPYLATFSGKTKFVRTDTFAVAVSNDWGTTGGPWHKLFERLFNMRGMTGSPQLPSSGSTAIAASLIA